MRKKNFKFHSKIFIDQINSMCLFNSLSKFQMSDYKTNLTNYQEDLRIPLTKATFESNRIPKREDINKNQVISNLSFFFSKLESLFVEANRLAINNEITKFNDLYHNCEIPYQENLITPTIAQFLINSLLPIDPLGSSVAHMIITLIRSSEFYAAVFFDHQIIEKIESIIFCTQMSRERTKEFLLILYYLANTTQAYRDMVFSQTKMDQFISFCISKPDTMQLKEFLIMFMIILCKYDDVSDEIFTAATSVMEVLYDDYKFDYKLQKYIVMLIKYLSFSPNLVPIIESSSIGDDLVMMLNNKEISIIRSVAIIFANILRNGISYSDLIGTALKIFLNYPDDPSIIIPTLDIFVSLLIKSSDTQNNPDFGLALSDLVNMIPLELLIHIIQNETVHSKQAALKVLVVLFQHDLTSIQNCITFGLFDPLMNVLSSNDKNILKDATEIAISLVETDVDINKNSTVHDNFAENDGISIFNEIEELFANDEEFVFKIRKFLENYYPEP